MESACASGARAVWRRKVRRPPRSSASTFPARNCRISLRAADFDYELPHELIAQAPSAVRDASRLMALQDGTIEHRTFRDLPGLLRSGDLLVLNETRVIAARLFGRRESGGFAEL